jgi:hypothetical protein
VIVIHNTTDWLSVVALSTSFTLSSLPQFANMIPAGPLFHKPKSIIAARNILYASLFLGVLGFLISEFSSIMPGPLNMRTLISNLIILLLLFIATYYIGFGKKWARTLFLALFIINAGASPIYVPFIFKASLVIGFLFILQMLLQILAVRYLYSKTSNEWFNNFKNANTEGQL